MKLEQIKQVSVLGAGIMGHGIANAFIMGGYPVRLYDVSNDILEKAVSRIEKNLALFKETGLISEKDIRPALDRLSITPDLAEAVKDADFITEAAPEDIALKTELYVKIESHCPEEAIIASNTSSLLLKDFGKKVKNKKRILITHWFNPPHIVPTVEVVKSDETSDENFDTAYALLKKIRKVPVRIRREIPGFLVNRIQVAMIREVFDLYEQGIASPEDIDAAVKGSIGFRLASIGPLLTADLGGLELWLRVAQNLLPQIRSSTETCRAIEDLVAQGHHGIKSGKGIFDYKSAFSSGEVDESVQKRDQEFLNRLKNLYWGTEA